MIEDRIMQMTQSEQQKEKKIIDDNSLKDLWDNFKNIWIRRVPEGEDKEKGVGNVLDEIIAENLLNQKNEIYPNR